MTYSSYAPITLPRDFWPDQKTYERTAAQMRSLGIEPPPIGVLNPMATSALGEGLYKRKSWMESPLLPALVMMGGAAAGGALGGAAPAASNALTPITLPSRVASIASPIGSAAAAPAAAIGPAASAFGPGAAAAGMNWSNVALGLRGAGLLGSGMMSGKGGGGSGDASAIQSQLALDLYGQTDPLRRALIARSQQYLGGGVDSSAQFGAFKAAAEPQFAQARDSVIANTPAGGGLVSALTQLEGQRARTLTQARGGIDEQELARAMTLGTGTTGQSLGTLGNAANTQAMIAQSQADREAGMLGALGMGAGAYFGSKV